MSNPVAFPFHATVKWPASTGLPDVMVNVYAETGLQLAERMNEAIEAARAGVPAFAIVTEAPAPQVPPTSVTPIRQPERYERDDAAMPRCAHGSDDWRESQYGGFYVPDCRCRITKTGELRARKEGDAGNANRTARFGYRAR